MNRRLLLTAALTTTALTVSGCGVRGLQSFHLPGGSAGRHAYKVTIIFKDVTALQNQSSVRANDVPVGDVDKIEPCMANAADGKCPALGLPNNSFAARVTVRIKRSVKLPQNAVAAIKQTSLLGEKYVDIGAPPGETATGSLLAGSFIPEQQSRSVPDLEEVFGALSLLLNGGGLEQLQTIATELSAALAGRESQVRDVLGQLDTFLGGLDSNKSEIVRALDSLNRLSKTLVEQKTTIATALTDIAPGLKILADKEPDLAGLLDSLARLGDVATRVIRETKANTVASLRSLDPVLTKLAEAGTYLPRALEVLLDYPFPRTASQGIFGDYTGLLADIDLTDSLAALQSQPPPALPVNSSQVAPPAGKASPTKPATPLLPLPLPTGFPSLPSLLDLKPGNNDNNSTGDNTDARRSLIDLLTGGMR